MDLLTHAFTHFVPKKLIVDASTSRVRALIQRLYRDALELYMTDTEALRLNEDACLKDWKKSMSARNRARIRHNIREIIELTDECAMKYDQLRAAHLDYVIATQEAEAALETNV